MQRIWLLQTYLLKAIILFNFINRCYLRSHTDFILLNQFRCNIKVYYFLLLLLLRNSRITWIFKYSSFQLNCISWYWLWCIYCPRFLFFPTIILRVHLAKNQALTQTILVLRSFSRLINRTNISEFLNWLHCLQLCLGMILVLNLQRIIEIGESLTRSVNWSMLRSIIISRVRWHISNSSYFLNHCRTLICFTFYKIICLIRLIVKIDIVNLSENLSFPLELVFNVILRSLILSHNIACRQCNMLIQ